MITASVMKELTLPSFIKFLHLNPFQHSDFTGSYMKCNAGIKWVQITYLEIIQIDLLDLVKPFKFILNIKKKIDFFGTGWKCVNLFHGTCLGIYSKTPENIWFSDVFRGYIERDQWHETGYYA